MNTVPPATMIPPRSGVLLALAPVAATPEDIQANRRGTISPSQRAMLQANAGDSPREDIKGLSCVAALLVPSVAVVAYGFFTATDARRRHLCLIAAAVMSIVLALSAVFARRARAKTPSDLKLGVARGAVSKRDVRIDGTLLFAIDVGDDRFFVGGRVYDALTAGEVYRVYYALPGRIMLSFEPDEGSGHPYRAAPPRATARTSS